MTAIDSGIEYLVITIAMGVAFFAGLSRREGRRLSVVDFLRMGGVNNLLSIDYNFSQAIKGISCVLILMGHYWSFLIPDHGSASMITKIEGMISANIALFFFMFFSGYGLSLKPPMESGILRSWLSRVRKIYTPLLVTCIVMLLLVAAVHGLLTTDDVTTFHLRKVITDMMQLSPDVAWRIVLSGIGWGDWYVTCILMFYTAFYLSQFIGQKLKINYTIALSMLMMVYFVWAFNYYGPARAHYYRYPWVFMLGHVVARWKSNPRWLSLTVIGVFLLTEIPCGIYYHLYSAFALGCLVLVAFISTAYAMRGRVLLFMGSISYFYYLCHERIACTLMALTGEKSLLLWALLTVPTAYGLKLLHDSFFAHKFSTVVGPEVIDRIYNNLRKGGGKDTEQ